MFEFLEFTFGIQALIIAILVGISAAILSPFLVLNEQALIADSLAHVSFTGIAIGLLLFSEPLIVSIPFAVLLSIITKYLSSKKNINGDSALGIVSTVALALGLIIIHKSSGFNRSIEAMMVGNMWTVNTTEIIVAFIVFLIVILFVVFNYEKLLLSTYDPKFAKFKKVNTNLLSYLLSIISAVLITVGVKTIGTLLISALIIFPSIIGMRFGNSFKNTLINGIFSSIFAVFFGISFSDFFNIPAGSTIIVTYAIILIVVIFFIKIKKGVRFRD